MRDVLRPPLVSVAYSVRHARRHMRLQGVVYDWSSHLDSRPMLVMDFTRPARLVAYRAERWNSRPMPCATAQS